ncbi:MAG: LL-diaminopimelate aminotransferase [Armatimonadota bacterium]|nr:LL-diaminopimelate aminotransferase [Armatimonadota bacterium]
MVPYADRLNSIPPYLFGEIARAKAKAISEGKDLIDFGIGDPDLPTPAPIIDRLIEAAKDPSTHRYDESDYGCPEFIAAAESWFNRRFGIKLDSSKGELLLLIGSKEGLAHLAWAYINPGDISLVPDPGYTVYKVNTAMAGGEAYAMPLLAKNGFLPDLTTIPTDVAKKAKLLFINYPNNPTGAVATKEFFSDVVAFAKEHNIIVCHDCAYSEVAYDGYKAPSFLEVEGGMDVGIELHSLSKTFNMTGWRVGFAAGNPEIVRALNKMKSNIDSKQFPAVDMAAAFALDNEDINRQTLDVYTRRRDILIDGLNSLGWNLSKTKATLYVWAPVPSGYTSMEFAKKLLEEAGVLVIPGVGYGQHGEGYVRFSLTVSGDNNGDRIAQAVDRMKKNLTINW